MQRELAYIIHQLKDRAWALDHRHWRGRHPRLFARQVFYTLMTSSDLDTTQHALERAAGFMRSEVARRIKLFTVPQLHFGTITRSSAACT